MSDQQSIRVMLKMKRALILALQNTRCPKERRALATRLRPMLMEKELKA